jgi:hypothetical protein
MQAKWGTFSFLSNGCSVTSRTRLVQAETGRVVRYITRVSVAGWLEGDSQSSLALQEDQLRAVLLDQYRDFKFLTDANAATPLSLLNSESLSGVRVVDGPVFADADGAEYATVRRFSFDLEAEFIVRGAENAVLSWTETVAITGTGGPVRNWRVPINAFPPIRQTVTPRSIVRATQTGRGVGHIRYPATPRPLWPQYERLEMRALSPQSPRSLGRAAVEWPVQWSYTFESDVPLVGFPSLPPF